MANVSNVTMNQIVGQVASFCSAFNTGRDGLGCENQRQLNVVAGWPRPLVQRLAGDYAIIAHVVP